MTRTRTNVTGGRGETLIKAVVEAPTRGKDRSQDRVRARGATLARGHGHGAAPVRGRALEVSS